jgi:hypothetical protein
MTDKSKELQELVVDKLIEVIRDGVTAVDKDGNKVTSPAPASYFTAAKDYLKQFPPKPEDVKTSPTGVLKQFVEEKTGRTTQLPFVEGLPFKQH